LVIWKEISSNWPLNNNLKKKFHDSRRRMVTIRASKQAMKSLSSKTKSRNQDLPLGHGIFLPYLEFAAVTFETRKHLNE
jgi:hypothetical protein